MRRNVFASVALRPVLTGPLAALLAGLAVALLVGTSSTGALAGTVYLKNDEEIDGAIVEIAEDEVVLGYPFGILRIDLRYVARIELLGSETRFLADVDRGLERARRRAELESTDPFRPIAGSTAPPRPTPPPTPPVPAPTPPAPAPSPSAQPTRSAAEALGARFESGKLGFSIDYPPIWTVAEEPPGSNFLTFRDRRPGASSRWRFNVTGFPVGEAAYPVVSSAADKERRTLDGYTLVRSDPSPLAGAPCLRTIGTVDRSGQATLRHDMIVVDNGPFGTLVFQFFTEGAPVEATGAVAHGVAPAGTVVREAELAIRSIKLRAPR